MNIGLIGCGNISSVYLRLAPQYRGITISACSDINDDVARTQADTYGIQYKSIKTLLADDTIELVINLTVPAAHAQVSRMILMAGKHVYSEKPYVLSYEEGCELQVLAAEKGLRIGSAPDTFLGGAHQCARAVIDNGEVGKVTGGTCHFMNYGMEGWHPNPDFFYQPGGGPMLDMGPYYISNLIQLIGPVKRVVSISSQPFNTRTISSEPRSGEVIPVDTATTIHTIMEFVAGATVTLGLSWDVRQHEHNCMELYAEHATLHVPDPNFFGGDVRLVNEQGERLLSTDHPFATVNDTLDDGERQANYRGAGLADMVDAIHTDRKHRCNDTFALHVIDVMTSALRSGETGLPVELGSTCERPEALDAAGAHSLLA